MTELWLAAEVIARCLAIGSILLLGSILVVLYLADR